MLEALLILNQPDLQLQVRTLSLEDMYSIKKFKGIRKDAFFVYLYVFMYILRKNLVI